ncbi:hypothetical protein ACS0TY_000519 [Phlomoides rotata]
MGSSILRWLSPKKVTGNSLRCFSSGICRSPGISSCPLLMLQTRNDDKYMVDKVHNLAENKVLWSLGKAAGEELKLKLGCSTEIVGSSHGWLCLFDESRNLEMSLYNPLSGRRINLPPIQHNLFYYKSWTGRRYVRKVILSCSPEQGQEECRAIMLMSGTGSLAFCWPGRSTEWTVLRPGNWVDIAYLSAQKLVCLSAPGGFLWDPPGKDSCLESWDLRDPTSPRLDWSVVYQRVLPFDGRQNEDAEEECFECMDLNMIMDYSHQSHYLVVSPLQQSELFHVIQYISPRLRSTIDFVVYKIVLGDGEEGRKWSESNVDLDGLVMFVGGVNDSVAVAASSDGFPPPNSICFTDDFRSSTKGQDNDLAALHAILTLQLYMKS